MMKPGSARPSLTRRQFLKAAGLLTAGWALFGTGGSRGHAVPGCTGPRGARSYGFPRHYDFLDHFAEATLETPDPAYVKAGEPIPVAGEGRFSLFAHAPARISFPAVPVYQEGRLEFGIGIHQEAWERPGDGVTFLVEGVDGSGRTHPLFERHLDPYNQPQDRRWFDESVDLGQFAGQQVQIVFRTLAGQHNQNDWAAWGRPRLLSEASASPHGDRPPNVLLISIDTLRADHVSSYGYPRQTTPTLDRLAAQGVRFLHAYSQSEHTNPSHSTMLTGLYPRSHGVTNNRTMLPAETVTIPERLAALGYRTAGAVSVYHLGPVWNMNQGFQDFYPTGGDRRRGGTTTDIALEWLIEQRQEPFFMWVHYFDPHAPYLPSYPYNMLYDGTSPAAPYRLPMQALDQPDDWLERYGDWPPPVEDVAEVIAQYDGAITYADTQVARLLAYLEEQELSDRTIVAVTSDHGEGFGEHGVAFDHFGLYEEMVHVPLIIQAPGRLPRGQEVEDLVSLVDLGPTLFELMGLPIPEDMQGTSLVDPMTDHRWRGHEGIVSQQHDDLSLSIRSPDWRLILQQQDYDVWPLYTLRAGQTELYDLQADPEETHNLEAAPSPDARRAQADLSESLIDWKQRTPPATGTTAAPLDEETEEMLRRLGY